MRRWTKLLLGSVVLLAAMGAARGAETVDYAVNFAPSGDAGLDSLLKQTSSLVTLQKKLPPAPFALIGRAQADEAQFLTVLHSLGYDAGAVTITIDGKALTDPALLSELAGAPPGQMAKVQVTPAKGRLFHLSRVDVAGLPPGFSPPAMVKPGDTALAVPILAVPADLLTALHNAGYAFATVSQPLAVASPATSMLSVTYTVNPGPRVNIGQIEFSGLKRTDPNFLRRHIALRPGQRYSDTGIQDARDSLIGLGVFSSATPAPASQAVDGRVPVMFHMIEQKRHAVTLSGAYATDTGFSIGSSWEDRNLFRRAETLTISVAANGLGGTGTTAPGYDLKGVFTKPDYYRRQQVLSLSLEAVKESLTAYDRTALLAGASLTRPVTKHANISFGPSFISERVNQEGVSRTYLLVQFPVNFSYSTANSVLEPTRGAALSLTLTPTEPMVGETHKPFLIALATGSIYLPVERNEWGVVAVHGVLGSIQGATQFQVPPDERFYAGGSGTVRGYTYQTIGPLFPDDNPEGGRAIDSMEFELRQHVTQNIGIVPFVDAGQVSASPAPFTGTLRVGAGLGARYYTGIGPIRLDVAFPLTRTAGSGAFALYAGLGEAF